MKTRVALFYPFDLGLELDFTGAAARAVVQEVSSHSLPPLTLGGRMFMNATAESHLYRFGVGLVQVNFELDCDLNDCADISCNAEKISVGKTAIADWCKMRVVELIERAQEFAAHRYDLRLEDSEIFPMFMFPLNEVEDADGFIRENYKALYGIVAGEANFDMLSDFVFQREPLGNFGYYQNEVIIVKRFGSVVACSESEKVQDLIALAYAQYWSLKSYHFVLDSEIDTAQKLLEELPPYYKFWKIPAQYQRFSRDAIDFGKDKLSIVDSLYNVSTNVPGIDSDWHLTTLYRNVAKVYNLDEQLPCAAPDHDVFGFQRSVYDSRLMRGGKGLGNA